ncbi:hypothetical protein A5740_06570 [Mycobacterium sp. GA-1841]|uniref:zinc ribbon domain-containing protein n=1 Tax=Mycobacterium sp. GA-1841 TaxID=1834154 RepID=UPI00096F87FD|nr:zinc ribbon domain-containing protein [Mycobacterium sp. GA-1841]OMC36287.1 hypothetical protein A5740_06570 [Mycobacterium sp. GA-1841]
MSSGTDSRRAPGFRLALGLFLAAVAASALLRLPTAVAGLAAFGLPLLFITYLRETAGPQSLPSRAVLLTVTLGVALGAGWAVMTGSVVAREYDVPVGSEGLDMEPFRVVRDGLAIPVGAMVVMLVPVLVIRVLAGRQRKPWDGFAFGALGALAFTAAATLCRLATQFDDGVVDHDRPLSGLLIQAGIQAVAAPVTAAAAGGLVGVMLGFSPPSAPEHHRARAVGLTAATVVGLYAALGLIDVAPVPQSIVLAGHLIVMAVAVLASRAGLRMVSRGVLGRVPQSGVGRPVVAWGVAVTLLTVALVAVSVVISDPPVRYICPPDCGSPPTSEPVVSTPRFTAPDGAFSVSYPASSSVYRPSTADDGVTVDYLIDDGGTMQLIGRPAGGRTPKQIAKALVEDAYPDAEVDYEIPNAMVGYQPGYGMVVDSWPQNSTGDYMRLRVVILAAVKNNLALIAVAVGPYHEYGPDFGPGMPSGANLDLAQDMGKYVNSFRWRGDPLR